MDLLGTADLRELEKRYLQGEEEVVVVLDAFAYQISKWICSMLPAFDGEKVDRIILTGGASRCRPVVEYIVAHVLGHPLRRHCLSGRERDGRLGQRRSEGSVGQRAGDEVRGRSAARLIGSIPRQRAAIRMKMTGSPRRVRDRAHGYPGPPLSLRIG